MPQYTYAPTRQPPTWWERMLVQPMAHAVAALVLVFGVLMTAGYLVTGVLPSPSMVVIPPVLIVASGAVLAVGGSLALVSMQWTGDRISRSWNVGLVGWAMSASGLTAYTIAAAASGVSAGAWLLPGFLAVGSALCWTALLLTDRQARRLVAWDHDRRVEGTNE